MSLLFRCRLGVFPGAVVSFTRTWRATLVEKRMPLRRQFGPFKRPYRAVALFHLNISERFAKSDGNVKAAVSALSATVESSPRTVSRQYNSGDVSVFRGNY